MSKNRFSQSATAHALASAISTLSHYVEIKAEVPAWMKHSLSSLRNPRPRGRPKGKLQYDDEPYLIEMGRLLETGEIRTRRGGAIAVMQSEQVLGASDDAIIKRLCESFKEGESRYRRLGREKIAKDETPENL